MILDAENMIFSAGNSFYCMIQQIDMGHLQIGIFQTGIIYSIRMILGRDFYFPGFKFLPDGFLPVSEFQLISPRAIGKPDHLMSKAYSK